MMALEYHKRIESIRSKLSKFRPDSVLARVMDHMHSSRDSKDPLLGMPWIVLFMLKISMQVSCGRARDMKGSEFYNIANEIYKLQGVACPLKAGNIHLMLRPMVLQQAWYQGDSLPDIRALTRQMMWYVSEGSPYDREFRNAYGLSLKEFYLVSVYIITCVANGAKGVVGIDLAELIKNLSPVVPVAQVFKYFSLVAVRSQDLPSFFRLHSVKGDLYQQSEYFQITPLRRKPILLDGENLLLLNSMLFSRSVAMLIPDLLKQINGWGFKNHFGPEMEAYIGRLFDCSQLNLFREERLNKFCKEDSVVKGKMVDYLVPGQVNVIFESKAIEPGDIVSAVFDTDKLRSHLGKNFIKGVIQCQESVYRLQQTRQFSGAEFVGVVVTHEDFWFSSANDIASYVDTSLESVVREKYGCLPIPFENILFVTIEMVECLVEAASKGDIQLGQFLIECIESLRTPSGNRFTTTHLIQEKLGRRLNGHPILAGKADEWLDLLVDAVESNPRFWEGRMDELAEVRKEMIKRLHQYFDSATPH